MTNTIRSAAAPQQIPADAQLLQLVSGGFISRPSLSTPIKRNEGGEHSPILHFGAQETANLFCIQPYSSADNLKLPSGIPESSHRHFLLIHKVLP